MKTLSTKGMELLKSLGLRRGVNRTSAGFAARQVYFWCGITIAFFIVVSVLLAPRGEWRNGSQTQGSANLASDAHGISQWRPSNTGKNLAGGSEPASGHTEPLLAERPARQGISADAQKLLAEMAAAYTQLKSYSATVEIKETGSEPTKRRSTLHYAKPCKIALLTQESKAPEVKSGESLNTASTAPAADSPAASGPAVVGQKALPPSTANQGPSKVISDGTFLYTLQPSQSGRYLKQALDSEEFGPKALMQYQPAGLIFTAALTGTDLLSAPWGRTPQALYKANPTRINGELCDIAVATFDNSETPGEPESIAYEMSQKDHLLRRIVVNRLVQGKRAIYIETHNQIQINPTIAADTFSFSPPSGWQSSERFGAPSWDARLKVGGEPLPFTAKTTEGQPVDLQQFHGKPLLLVFWASWCHSCRGEMPHVRAAYEAYKDKGFEVLGVSLDNQTAQMQSFTAKHQMPWRQICEEKSWKSSLVQQYGLRSIPFSLLIGPDGKIVALNPQRLHLQSLLHKLLGPDKH